MNWGDAVAHQLAQTDQVAAALAQPKAHEAPLLIHQLIRERWQHRQPSPSIAQRIGGHPEFFLNTAPPGSADREQRRRRLGQVFAARQAGRR